MIPELRRIALETRGKSRAKPSSSLFVDSCAEKTARTPKMQLSTFCLSPFGLQELCKVAKGVPLIEGVVASEFCARVPVRSFLHLLFCDLEGRAEKLALP